MWMVVDLGVSTGVVGLLDPSKVSEMKRNQFEQCFNLTDLLGLIGLNFSFVCNFLLNNLPAPHPLSLEVPEYPFANAASFIAVIAGHLSVF